MIDQAVFNGGKGWFLHPGPDFDVVISSRIRLSRNLSRNVFPGRMTDDDEREVESAVADAFSRLPEKHAFSLIPVDNLTPDQRKLLLERNILPAERAEGKGSDLFLREDQQVFCTVNSVDHLRIAGLFPGLSLEQAWTEVDTLDSLLEESLEYAVSFDLGYLSSEVSNAGTGMRASAMLHLPALMATGLIDNAVKAIGQVGFSVKSFFGDGTRSLGGMYLVSNQITIGMKEKEILEKLEGIIQQLVHYERKAKEEMMDMRPVAVEDPIWRAYGILRYCRSINAREAIELLSALRLGVALGVIRDVPLETVTALLFLTQKAHVRFFMGAESKDADEEAINAARAGLVQKLLEQTRQ